MTLILDVEVVVHIKIAKNLPGGEYRAVLTLAVSPVVVYSKKLRVNY